MNMKTNIAVICLIFLVATLVATLVSTLGCAESMPGTYLNEYASGGDAMATAEAPMEAENSAMIMLPQTDIKDATVERKIIYTADVDLVVDNFDGIDASIRKLVQRHQGYVDSQNLERMRGESRIGHWTVRIPVEQYEEFLDGVSDLGVPTSQHQDAQDVTEEFVDLEARIANKKKLETRILELLERPDDKIQHVIEVERELARVRQDIEQMQGRLRYLKDRTSMTTVSISVREERDYQPPQTPNLSNRVSTAWSNSIDRFQMFCEDAIVFLVANAIALIITLVMLILGLLFLRIMWKRLFTTRTAS